MKKKSNKNVINYKPGENQSPRNGEILSGSNDFEYLSGLLNNLNCVEELTKIIFDLKRIIKNGNAKLLDEFGYYYEGNGYIEHSPTVPNLPYVEISDQAGLYLLTCYKNYSLLWYKNSQIMQFETNYIIEVLEKWVDSLKQ